MTVLIQPRAVAAAGTRYGGFWVRLVAFLVDAIAIGAIATAVNLARGAVPPWDQGLRLDPTSNLVNTVVGFVYLTVLWSELGAGQTLGMRLLGLRVVSRDGGLLGLGQAVVRWFGIVLSAAVVLLGLAWVAVDPRKRGWHDKLAGSFVIETTGRPTTDAPSANDDARPVTSGRGWAAAGAILGLLATALGVAGLALVVAGDRAIVPGTPVAALGAVIVALGFVAGIALPRPAIGLAGFVLAAAAMLVIVGPLAGPWYEGLLAATAAGPVPETRYWSDAPAVPVLLVSWACVVLAAVAALPSAITSGEATR
jgi:uncharacterized RDD family membrane protein YckC